MNTLGKLKLARDKYDTMHNRLGTVERAEAAEKFAEFATLYARETGELCYLEYAYYRRFAAQEARAHADAMSR